VGNTHQEIGLDPRGTSAHSPYLRLALRDLVARTGDGAGILPTIEALVKSITFDMALAMRTYVYGGFVSRVVADQFARAANLAEHALEARADTERLGRALRDGGARPQEPRERHPDDGPARAPQGRRPSRSASRLPQQIDLTCREMMRLIQNLLEISKIEEGRCPSPSSRSCWPARRRVLAEHRLLATQAGRRLQIDVSTTLPPVAPTGALAPRARQPAATPSVAAAARSCTSRRAEAASKVVLTVRDEGGIPAAQRDGSSRSSRRCGGRRPTSRSATRSRPPVLQARRRPDGRDAHPGERTAEGLDVRGGAARASASLIVFRLRHLCIDTLREHVVMIHESAVRAGDLGFHPLDRVRVVGETPGGGPTREITGVLNFCRNALLAPDEIGLSDLAFADFGLPEGAPVRATIAPAPPSVDHVRHKLHGGRLDRAGFDAILTDVVRNRYSRLELAMFVLACGLRTLDLEEVVAFTEAMIGTGTRLDFGPAPCRQALRRRVPATGRP
jgi:hypothetical protein